MHRCRAKLVFEWEMWRKASSLSLSLFHSLSLLPSHTPSLFLSFSFFLHHLSFFILLSLSFLPSFSSLCLYLHSLSLSLFLFLPSLYPSLLSLSLPLFLQSLLADQNKLKTFNWEDEEEKEAAAEKKSAPLKKNLSLDPFFLSGTIFLWKVEQTDIFNFILWNC